MQGNPFGPFFTAAAQKVGAAKKHDGFDSSVVQVRPQNLAQGFCPPRTMSLCIKPSWCCYRALYSTRVCNAWTGA